MVKLTQFKELFMEYVLKDVCWYYTNNEFVPYIVNKDKTKIKILLPKKSII